MSDVITINGYKVKDEKAVRSYETVALMKADTKLKEGYHVKTKGYYAIDDGGHGEYIIVDDETLVDDGGSIHVLSNGLRAKLLINENTINVKQFGAKNDDSVDCSLIINKALSICDKVFIPKGRYLINNTIYLYSYKKLFGEKRNTILHYVGENNSYCIEVPKEEGLTNIEDISIYGNGKNEPIINGGILYPQRPTTGLTVYDSGHILNNVYINSMSGNGIVIENNQRGCKLYNVNCVNIGGHGIYVNGTDNSLINVSVGEIGKHGIYLNQNNRYVNGKPFACGTSNPNTYYALYLANNYNNISNVDIQQETCNGIYIGGQSNLLTFNSDGVGWLNTSNDISVLVFNEKASYNKIICNITNGTFTSGENSNHQGILSRLVKFEERYLQVGNKIDINFYQYSTVLNNVEIINQNVHPSNIITVNQDNYSLVSNDLSNNSSFTVHYTGDSTPRPTTTYTDNEVSYSDIPIDFTSINEGSGIQFRHLIASNLVTNNDRIAISCEFESNLPLNSNIAYRCFLFVGNNQYQMFNSDRFNPYRVNNFNKVNATINIKDVSATGVECYLVFNVYKIGNITGDIPQTVNFKVKNIKLNYVTNN